VVALLLIVLLLLSALGVLADVAALVLLLFDRRRAALRLSLAAIVLNGWWWCKVGIDSYDVLTTGGLRRVPGITTGVFSFESFVPCLAQLGVVLLCLAAPWARDRVNARFGVERRLFDLVARHATTPERKWKRLAEETAPSAQGRPSEDDTRS
jgi:hypothetical protein